MGALKKAVVLGGKTGLLGQALCEELTISDCEVFSPVRQELDVFSEYDLAAYLDRCQPDVLFNTIGYTQVDNAEKEPEEAKRVNEDLCTVIASVLKTRPCKCLSVSTDFVFDGEKGAPYFEDDIPAPQSVYGKTKLAGEMRLLDIIPEKTIIGRTAWLWGPHKINFVHKMLHLAKEREFLSVVDDQVGSPTFTLDLAAMCTKLAATPSSGVYHLVNSGKASWYELAATAIEMSNESCIVSPIASHEFKQLASRPGFSVLSNQKYADAVGETPREWIEGLAEYVALLTGDASPLGLVV